VRSPGRWGGQPEAPAGARDSRKQPSRRLRILLAEDNAINQKLAIRRLEKQGHSVTVANDGCQVVATVEDREFDVVLMDLQMPNMSGLEATAIIRTAERRTGKHIPIVAMAAHALKDDQERCLEAGMGGYVSKPIQPDRLMEAIMQVTSSAGTGERAPCIPA